MHNTIYGSHVSTVGPTTHQRITVAQVLINTATHAISVKESTLDSSAEGREKEEKG